MKYGENNVITCPAIVLWDGITRPEDKDDGKGGKFKQYSIKVALLASSPEVKEIEAIATAALTADAKFRGQLPAGGNWPILQVAPTDFEGRLPAHIAFNAKSSRCPQVFDANNQELPPLAYQNMLYAGSTVRVIVHAFSFDNKSKGIALGLDGIQILDATTPRLPVGGVDAAAAFGGTAAPQAVAPPPAAPAAAPLVMLPAANGVTYEAYRSSGWTDEQLIAGGFAARPAVAAPPPAPAPVTPPPPAAPAGPGVAPAPSFLTPPPPAAPAPPVPTEPVMLPAAQGVTYAAFRAQGWTDEQLRAQGYIQ